MKIDIRDFTPLIPAGCPIKRYTLWDKAREFYCRRLTAVGRCAQNEGFTCRACHPYLQEAMRGLPNDNKPLIGLYIWRLRNAAAGAMEQLKPPPPKRRKEWEEARNPFEVFLEELDEATAKKS